MFYEFDQNNSGGHFHVDDKVCHRLFIEADNEKEALRIAEDIGCYWNGVADGIDCPCCGDRWDPYGEEINLIKYAAEGYRVHIYTGYGVDAVAEWNRRYGKYKIVEAPTFKKDRAFERYEGSICFNNIEEYVQYIADEYGWTTPDARIFYKDGRVREIYSAKRGEA